MSASGFDSLDQLAWTADAAGTTNRYAYDTLGRPSGTALGAG